MRDVLFLNNETEKLDPLIELSKNCGWWIPYENICIIQHRHTELHFSADGQLHNESGMSVKYRDGWGLWSINGVSVDEQIVMSPETQTINQITSEGNEDIKRVRIERYGWQRFMAESDATVIDSRRNEIENTKEMLVECGGMRALVCHCPSTGRVYFLERPSDITTCEQAEAWGRSNDETRYKKTRRIGAT